MNSARFWQRELDAMMIALHYAKYFTFHLSTPTGLATELRFDAAASPFTLRR